MTDTRPTHQPDGSPITYEWDADDPHAGAHSVLCKCSTCLLPDDDEPHVGHYSRLGGQWWCDTCDSPYCELA